jgi:hypothetical protein
MAMKTMMMRNQERTMKWIAGMAVGLGLALMAIGWATQSSATGIGRMDCGCGGRTECVTKQRTVAVGEVFALLGLGVLVAGTGFGWLGWSGHRAAAGCNRTLA